MRIRKLVSAIGIISLVIIGLGSVSFAQDKATPRQIVQKVKEAVNVLEKSKGANLTDFDKPNGPWVFKNTYVIIQDCKKGTIAAHPLVPKLVGKKGVGLQDVKGNLFFVQLCEAAKKPGGGWVEYWFPKPHQKTPSRKISYALQVPGTSLVAIAGIYSDKLSVPALNKMVKK